MDAVAIAETSITFNKNTQRWDMTCRRHNCVISLERWLGMSTSEEDCIAKVKTYLESSK